MKIQFKLRSRFRQNPATRPRRIDFKVLETNARHSVDLGGVGAGFYGILLFAILAIFLAGLMVGRTPEYLGKKIEAYEMKMASLVILLPAAAVLVGTALACAVPAGSATLGNPGAHGFSEILYAFTSAAGNNGSAMAGLNANTPFWDVLLAVAYPPDLELAEPRVLFRGGAALREVLPGVDGSDDEVFAQLPGPVGTRRAGTPRLANPDYPGVVKELPIGHRIDSYGATCMATDDGVACFGAAGGAPQGFRVSASETTTFGGS